MLGIVFFRRGKRIFASAWHCNLVLVSLVFGLVRKLEAVSQALVVKTAKLCSDVNSISILNYKKQTFAKKSQNITKYNSDFIQLLHLFKWKNPN